MQSFGRKTGRKETPGRPRRRWKDIVKIDLEEIGFQTVDWIHMAQNRDQWRAVMNTTALFGILSCSLFIRRYAVSVVK
jgi:hypothetical protein